MVAVLLLAPLAACSSGPSSSGDESECEDGLDCPWGECVDGRCVDRADVTSEADVPEPIGGGTSETDSDSGDFLSPCTTQDDCESGYCLASPLGRVCTIHCQWDEECEAAAGWRCRMVAGRGADIEELCYPESADLCNACSFDTDCGGTRDRCVDLDDGRFCGLDCSQGSACPVGYSCSLFEDGVEQCVPDEFLCGPCRGADLMEDMENCGECGRRCAAANAVATCRMGVCEIAACDTGYANCDGAVETGCETEVSDDVENCGGCGVLCTSETALVSCQDSVCVEVACESGHANCDGSQATGCETSIAADVNNCGGCGVLCTSETALASCQDSVCVEVACASGHANCDGSQATGCETNLMEDPSHCGQCGHACDGLPCIEGACGCEGQEIVCDGVCTEPNACGGCAELEEAPESPCGPCGLDEWVCDGQEGVTCGGATTDACGGCEAMEREVGDGCGVCGEWTCEGEGWICSGEVDLDTDDANCGSCGTICTGGSLCDGGACVCPEGEVPCAGECRPDNGCGGCGELAHAPGTVCGPCGTGEWVCAPESMESVECTAGTNDRVSVTADFAGGAWPEGWETAWFHNSEGAWRVSSERSMSAGHSAHVRGSGSSRSEHRLTMAPIEVPVGGAGAELRFRSWLSAEGTSLCFDGAGMDFSLNGGASWSVVPGARVLPTWNITLSTNYGNPRGGSPTWCYDHDWREVIVDLSAWEGQTVMLRFWYATDESFVREGWYVDDVTFSYTCPE